MLLVFSRIERPLSKLLHKFVAKGFFFKSLEIDEFGMVEALSVCIVCLCLCLSAIVKKHCDLFWIHRDFMMVWLLSFSESDWYMQHMRLCDFFFPLSWADWYAITAARRHSKWCVLDSTFVQIRLQDGKSNCQPKSHALFSQSFSACALHWCQTLDLYLLGSSWLILIEFKTL
jgi:hypothetical protein